MFVWPSFWKSNDKKLFAFDADEQIFFKSESELNEFEKKLDDYNKIENAIYWFSLLPITTKDDNLILDKVYESKKDEIEWYKSIYKQLWLDVTDNIYFSEVRNFYKTAINIVKINTVDIISTIWYSTDLLKYFPDTKPMFDISNKINAKSNFLNLANKYSFRIPETNVLNTKKVKINLDKQAFPIFLKLDWIWWWRNVFKLDKLSDFESIEDIVLLSDKVLIQKSVPENYIEITVEILIDWNDYKIYNIQWAMTYWTKRYGCMFIDWLKLNNFQRLQIDNLVRGVINEWYTWDKPIWLWIDAFVNDSDIYITEFNARWISTTPIELVLEKLWILNKIESVAVYDQIFRSEYNYYKYFVENNLFGVDNSKGFSIVPLSTWYMDMANWYITINFIVVWNFNKFVDCIKKEFSIYSFTYMDNTIREYNNWKSNFNKYFL